ncbi:hypothetical protein CH296_26635 [Rhodococcus sp. 14-2496-1d]|uniref:amidohydrolase family protein n=1 Tax=Rhodococcus sp. 14-2496-1d TaxID=2023146 RepID=UPI000B9BDFA1|nr:amidohydrolase family protein [Rhodococcus sp. 14-2496-1d]OZF25694.1 hypothetical protein CH296_26635 [Rhodococcus sp. 14-2496-1d]
MNESQSDQDDVIVDPTLRIIDAHHHLYDRAPMPYTIDDLMTDTQVGHDIAATVYVETQAHALTTGPELLRPVGEIGYVTTLSATAAGVEPAACRVAAAIIGFADLTAGHAIADALDAFVDASPNQLRGVRQNAFDYPSPAPYRFMTYPPPRGILQAPGFDDGFGQLAARGLSFDAAVFHTQIPEIAALADRHPNTTIVLDHLGLPMAVDTTESERAEVFARWTAALHDLARRPNVTCKVGGFGMPFWGWPSGDRTSMSYQALAAEWKPLIETAIEAFGADRAMMESNFPLDSRTCDYRTLWNSLKHAVADYSADERVQLFSGTAARVYRIDL